MTTPHTDPTAFSDKVFHAALGTMETFNLYLGDRLGWFDALAEARRLQPNWPNEPRLSRATRSSGWS
jgi:hypothetical protein